MSISRSDFDRVYSETIIGRTFVEFPRYYALSRERYWRSLRFFERLPLAPGSAVLDIGGGQFGVLLDRLAGHSTTVGDVTDTAAGDVRALGVGFRHMNLLALPDDAAPEFDCITALEVIEHLPVPAYVVIEKLMGLLKPGGFLFMTTPNGYRVRNLIYMILGRRILDHYRYPDGDEGMGHQLEYTLPELEWQVRRAGCELVFAEHFDDGWKGETTSARIARIAVKPVSAVPHLRNSIAIAARCPDGMDGTEK